MGGARLLPDQAVMDAPIYADPINYEMTPRTMRIGATTGEQLMDDKDVFHALEREGYFLLGHGIRGSIDDLGSTLHVSNCVDFEFVLQQTRPQVIVLDQRSHWLDRDPDKRFRNLNKVADHRDIFRVVVIRGIAEHPKELFDFYSEFQPHTYLCPMVLGVDAIKGRYSFIRTEHVLWLDGTRLNQPADYAAAIEMVRRQYGR